MDQLRTLYRLTRVEIFKFWRKPIAWFVLGLMLLGPVLGESLLASFSIRDATFPRVSSLLFSADMLMMLSLITVVLSVMALGNDYELGTVGTLLTKGVDRYQFILSKIFTSVSAALANGFVFLTAGLVAVLIVHNTVGATPFLEAAGANLIWRALGAVVLIGLVNAVLSGVVMLALVVGQNSWMGMLAGLGYFFFDFAVGGIGPGEALGVEKAYRYTLTYHAVSLAERLFPSDPALSLPRDWVGVDTANPGSAALVLLLYAVALTILATLVFRRQDVRMRPRS